ncbi:MAG: hypothetical protein HGA68_03180, partial [Methanothrix sp.]|nr:hypothetical protein [Methanothrix sp.]
MVTLEKMARLATECRFDCLGQGSVEDAEGLNSSAAEESAGHPAARIAAGNMAEGLDERKLATLGEGTRHDVCASTFSPRSRPLPGICHAFTQDGRCVSLFKTLYTNLCSHQCGYCSNSAGCKGK